MESPNFKDISEALKNLPNNDETRRKALLLTEFLTADENAKTSILDIENGLYRDTFSVDESALAERLFLGIKDEFQLESQKDLMDLYLMIANFIKSKRFMRLHDSGNLDDAKRVTSILKSLQDSYASLGRELGLNRQQRLVRRAVRIDETGSITEIFAAIDQQEVLSPKKKAIKRKKKKKAEVTV